MSLLVLIGCRQGFFSTTLLVIGERFRYNPHRSHRTTPLQHEDRSDNMPLRITCGEMFNVYLEGQMTFFSASATCSKVI